MKNFREDVVLEALDKALQANPSFCRCQKCRQDVILLALSKIKGRYASSPVGEIFARVEQSDRQVRTDALLAVMQALEQVAVNPRHDGPLKLTKK
ncbi:MAG: late competence development ComFB family protein [Firmicutes bacterium]|nr:late competence development ComFB family protein [Bacillota bacterium]